MRRRAMIYTTELETVATYLPMNYRVVGTTVDTESGLEALLIEGEDSAGWTLNDYVLPRLGSGLFFGKEIPCPEQTPSPSS